MQVRAVFNGLYQQLEGHLRASAQIKHQGGKGAHREAVLRHLFADYLPRRYACGTGTLLSTSGRQSRQCDIVIHDDFNQPLLLRSDEHSIFAAGAVFGVVEVKSTLSSDELSAAHQNIRAAKETADRRDFFGGVIGFTAGRTLAAVANQVAELIRETNDPNLIPNYIAVLDQGLIETLGQRDGGVRILRSEHNTLFHFFVKMLAVLNRIELTPVDYDKYAGIPVSVGDLWVRGHDCFIGSHDDGRPRLLRLQDRTIRRIYESCQAAGEQQLIREDELQRIHSSGSILGSLVVGTGFLYNPKGRKVISYDEVAAWKNGHAIVGPDEVYPQYHISINGELYYLDMAALDDTDFEDNADLALGELTWEYPRY